MEDNSKIKVMLENLEKMSKDDAQKRLKKLKREILKHEIVFILFILIGVTNLTLMLTGFVSFGFLNIMVILGCALACYGIFKYSEPYEVEKALIQVIISLTDEK